MSWLSDYIGKAESLLNALDSSAGDLLSNSMTEAEDHSLSSTAVNSSFVETLPTPDISSLSSSYLNQQSPVPSFARSASQSSTGGGGGGAGALSTAVERSTKYRSGSGDSTSSPLHGLKSAMKPSSARSSTSSFASSHHESQSRTSSASPSAAAMSYSMDLSRLSQQLMRGAERESDYPVSSAANAASHQSKPNPVIASPHSSSPKEDDFLIFLNAPKSSDPSSSTSRASPLSRPMHVEEKATHYTSLTFQNKSEAVGGSDSQAASLAKEENPMSQSVVEAEELPKEEIYNSHASALQPCSMIDIDSELGEQIKPNEIKCAASAPVIQTEYITFCDSQNTPLVSSSDLADSTKIIEIPETFASFENQYSSPGPPTGETLYAEKISVDLDTQEKDYSSQERSLSKSSACDDTEGEPLILCQESRAEVASGVRSSERTSSSKDSSDSGASTDGEEADLSDAMKESPISPFEESEPEMVASQGSLETPQAIATSADTAPSQEEVVSSSGEVIASLDVMVSSSDIRYPSSGGQTESEPEMVPSPPLAGDRLMTASQVSSSISQRFSDCEILSAAEFVETEDENSSSPVEESPFAVTNNFEGVYASNAASSEIQDKKLSSYAQGFFPLIGNVTSAFEGAFQTSQDENSSSVQPSDLSMPATNKVQSLDAVFSSNTLSTSKLELENELLRSEIRSLNEEMQGAWQQVQIAKEDRCYAEESAAAAQRRSKEYEERMRAMAEEFANDRSLLSAQAEDHQRDMERKLHESANLLSDAQMSVSAKDGQLAVLRVRLEEADSALEETRRKCDVMKDENRKIVADRDAAVTTHVAAFETLKAHADHVQHELAAKTADNDRLREEVFSVETAFADEKESLGSMITSLQSQLAAERSRCLSLQHQVNGSQSSLDGVKKELYEYRAKATRTLQSKDRLITSLQDGSSSSSSSPAALLELDDVKNERDLLREEVTSLQTQLETSRIELADAEAQAVQDREMSEDRLAASVRELGDYKDKIESMSQDFARSKQELTCAHDQLHRDRIQFQEETLKQSEENDNLKRQIEAQASSSASSPDVEARLQALAENLIEKQTTIESLATEKTSLKLQLERLSASATHSSNYGNGGRSTPSVSIVVEDDRPDYSSAQSRMRLPLLFREAPDDTGVTRGVKRAATTLDALGFKIGVFFRRYPVARVFALVYAFILHVWVFIVLLTYTPEIH